MSNWDIKALIINLKAECAALKRLTLLTKDEAPPEVTGYLHQMAKQSNDLVTRLIKSEEGSLPITVAVVGDFSAGKSSFINHFLQDGSICPEDVSPTTSVVTRFMYGSEERVTIHSSGKKRRKIGHEDYVRRVKEQPKDSTINQNVRFTFEMPNDALRGLELLDTPGLNNPKNPNDDNVAESIMAESDAFICLIDGNLGEIPQSAFKTLERLKSKAPDSTILLLINKADTKSPPAILRIKNTFKAKNGNLFDGHILTYSTKEDRHDIDTRHDITSLLADLRNHATKKKCASLGRSVKRHYDTRLTAGAKIEAILDIKTAEIECEARHRDERLEKVGSCYREFSQQACRQFIDELGDALRCSLVVEEVPNSGWFWNDGCVIYKPKTLMEKIKSSRIFQSLNEETNRILRPLLGKVNWDAFSGEREACAYAADKAVALMACVGGRFYSVESAAERLQSDYDNNSETIFDAAFKPLLDALVRIWTETRGHYDEQTSAIRASSADFARATKRLRSVHQQGMTLFK